MEITGIQNANIDVLKQVSTDLVKEKQAQDFQNTLDEAVKKQDQKALQDACKQFEAYFMQQMLKEMRSTIQRSDFIAENRGEEIFTEMLDEEYSKEASKGGGIGLAKMLYEQLSKTESIPVQQVEEKKS